MDENALDEKALDENWAHVIEYIWSMYHFAGDNADTRMDISSGGCITSVSDTDTTIFLILVNILFIVLVIKII